MILSGKTIVVGVTGGIAAYKACTVVSLLKKAGADVTVAMTDNACEFVTPLTFETLAGSRVITGAFDRGFEYDVRHVSLAKSAHVFLIAPATANFIGKYACGIADDFLTTAVMAYRGPVLVAPAMNTGMWNSPAVSENITKLKARGIHFIDPVSGRLACGDTGAGKLAEPADIVAALTKLLQPKTDFDRKTVLITAGATREPIDPVRYLTNRSSGKMGVALAEAAANRGARVIFVHGEMAVPAPVSAAKTVAVQTTDEMYTAVTELLSEADIIIMAAAPSDYKPSGFAAQKIKSKNVVLNLVKNVDIAAAVGKNKGNKILVAFAAETENLLDGAREKLRRKNADLVVANDVTEDGAGFSVDTNVITLVTRDAVEPQKKMTKRDAADVILDKVSEFFRR
jgi:phosphopantothenoylcysteine decarboxylase/phosphopantothenate--cysteine ligase